MAIGKEAVVKGAKRAARGPEGLALQHHQRFRKIYRTDSRDAMTDDLGKQPAKPAAQKSTPGWSQRLVYRLQAWGKEHWNILVILSALVLALILLGTAEPQDKSLFAFGIERAGIAALDTTEAGTVPLQEKGEASYYGYELAGKPTASGEPFNPEAMTAAHPTLPFGAHVRVTNLHNEQTVVVRINDRGPFAKDRVIDVSRAAAEELDMLHRGRAPVRIEVLGD